MTKVIVPLLEDPQFQTFMKAFAKHRTQGLWYDVLADDTGDDFGEFSNPAWPHWKGERGTYMHEGRFCGQALIMECQDHDARVIPEAWKPIAQITFHGMVAGAKEESWDLYDFRSFLLHQDDYAAFWGRSSLPDAIWESEETWRRSCRIEVSDLQVLTGTEIIIPAQGQKPAIPNFYLKFTFFPLR